jgi:hypothetical protein
MARRERMPDLQRLRGWRNFRERDLSIGGALADLTKDLRRQHRAVGGIGEAWAALVPPEVRRGAELVKLSRGVLTVKVTDAAARFALDRWLRGGGEAALARAPGVVVKRVKLV